MIRAHFGLGKAPFFYEGMELLAAQREVFDTLRVHCQQGGLCVVVGEPGTGKSVLKEALRSHEPKRLIAPIVNRTLHTYHGILRILCESFQIDTDGRDIRCEKRLIQKAERINQQGKMLAIIIDDAHLIDLISLRRLRLLLEDFPKNLILIAQPELLTTLALTVNDDIKSRVTYSVMMPRLNPDDIESFIKGQLDRVSLSHATFTPEALGLIARSSEGALRAAKNLSIASLLEAVRDRTRTVDLKQVNRVLLQPHWRRHEDLVAQSAATALKRARPRQLGAAGPACVWQDTARMTTTRPSAGEPIGDRVRRSQHERCDENGRVLRWQCANQAKCVGAQFGARVRPQFDA